MDLSKDKPKDPEDIKHADQIWGRYNAYLQGRPAGPEYEIPDENPFDDWRITQRYAHRTRFDEIRASRHREGARVIRAVIRQAQLDGIIP
jgi:hypothetical protein